MPMISVCIPTYARSELLRKAIQSCLDQDFQDYEILIGDDCPTDESGKVAKSFDSPRIRYTHYSPPVGVIHKLNRFLEDARGEWMVILGDDDTFEPGYLSAMDAIVRRYPDAALVRTRYHFIDHNGNSIKLAPNEPERLEPEEFLNVVFLPWYKRLINITGILFRRRKLLELGGFLRTDMGWNSDTAAWAWLGAQGPCYFESRPLVRLGIAPDSLYKKFHPDYRVYLERKRLFFGNMSLLFRQVLEGADPSKRRKIERARRLFVRYWIREECRLIMDDIFLYFLKQDDAVATKEVAKILETLKTSDLPLYSALFSFYGAISVLPAPLRKTALTSFLKARHVFYRLFPRKRWTYFNKGSSEESVGELWLG